MTTNNKKNINNKTIINKNDEKFIKNIVITTPLYYPSGKLHLGNGYTSIMSDIIYKLLVLRNYNVFLCSGNDEHGKKIHDISIDNHLLPFDFCKMKAYNFSWVWESLNIVFLNFVDTANEKHKMVVAKVLKKIMKTINFKLAKYKKLYCWTCESIENNSDNKKCFTCKKECVEIDEENYFWEFSKEDNVFLKSLLEKKGYIHHKLKNYIINNFLNDNLKDLSISRENLTWGVGLPGGFLSKKENSQTLYVWIDALMGYLTNMKYYRDFSNKICEFNEDETIRYSFIGKDILKFHSVYLQLILKKIGFKNTNLIVHGFINDKKSKMSKSLNNSIPIDNLLLKLNKFEFLNENCPDVVRFYIAIKFNNINDVEYSTQDFIKVYNEYLVNKIGNTASRLFKLITQKNIDISNKKYFENESFYKNNKLLNDIFNNIEKINPIKFLNENLSSFTIKPLIDNIDLISEYIEKNEIWTKTGDSFIKEANILIYAYYMTMNMFGSVIPITTSLIIDYLQIDNMNFNINYNGTSKNERKDLFFKFFSNMILNIHEKSFTKPLFPRIKEEEFIKELKNT